MTTGTKEALAVKAMVVAFMNEQVYRGDYDNPRIKPDKLGSYHYRDGKIEVWLAPSKRDGWLNPAVTVQLVRRRWPFRRLEPVLVTGHGVEVSTYRPGLWVDYITDLLEKIKDVQRVRDEEAKRKSEADERDFDANFSPVDDSAIFKK
ncbi:MAG TPA: hypothetical protein VF131_02015 [Blastocatellia bacterium]|nr:hypothetical protein [Blastocatellia bacterium]